MAPGSENVLVQRTAGWFRRAEVRSLLEVGVGLVRRIYAGRGFEEQVVFVEKLSQKTKRDIGFWNKLE